VDVNLEGSRAMLEVFAGTALNSKLISNQKDLFAPMVIDSFYSPLPVEISVVFSDGCALAPARSSEFFFFILRYQYIPYRAPCFRDWPSPLCSLVIS